MAILGITNRTENWKTAAYFAPLFGHRSVRLARRLGAPREKLEPGDVRLELFWKGMRDYVYQHQRPKPSDADLIERYDCLFGDLRSNVEGFGGFQALTCKNYTSKEPSRLASNLRNTEIDIVLESSGYLFIGEAKHKTTLHASSRDVLTHQLIRQYVTARILLDLLAWRRRSCHSWWETAPQTWRNGVRSSS
jgi:hypothetical protein